MKPTLLILAAGMGSRYGGLKQIEPLGPNGETIIEYSIYDAIRAGFGKVVFVIRESFAEELKKRFETMLHGKIETGYVYQELDRLPKGFSLPKDREKPWGTGHAILVAKSSIKEPFAVINADDFYGREAYQIMADYLTNSFSESEYAMVGYKLNKTLSDFGTVSRGISTTNSNDELIEIKEVTKIGKENDHIFYYGENEEKHLLEGTETVSMNFWGFKPSIFKHLEDSFIRFLEDNINKPKSEFYIPSVVFELIQRNIAQTKVLRANSPWFGVTYQEDKPIVISKLQKLIEEGVYPEKLW